MNQNQNEAISGYKQFLFNNYILNIKFIDQKIFQKIFILIFSQKISQNLGYPVLCFIHILSYTFFYYNYNYYSSKFQPSRKSGFGLSCLMVYNRISFNYISSLIQIYELRNQFYFIDLIYSPHNQFRIKQNERDCYTAYIYTRYLSNNIFFFLNNHYIYGLLFSTNWFFRESYRKKPGTKKLDTCYDDYEPQDCYYYDYEEIAPQYHGPYLTQLANFNIILFAFSCLYLLFRFSTLIVINKIEELIESHHFNINIVSVKKKSQFVCIILTIYYICRATHSFIIYFQVQNETLLYSIGAYIFYSLMMISVLVSIIILIQLKFTKEKNYHCNFVSVSTLIDQIIYQNKYLNYYFWIMLIVSFALTCVGIPIYRMDKNVQDIVNYENYVLTDLIIAQMVFIFFMLIKYVPFFQRSQNYFIKINKEENYNQVDRQINIITITSQEDQIDQNQKSQINVIIQHKQNILNNCDQQFQQFQLFLQKKSKFLSSSTQIKTQDKSLHKINSFVKQKKFLNIKSTIFYSKIIKFWKKTIQKDLKKRRKKFIQSMRKPFKEQEINITYDKKIQFIDQMYLGQCTICLEQFEIINKTKSIIRLNCFGHHIFHAGCIQNWFKNNKKCPICNTNQFDISYN